jgi:hypothetical protein
MRLLRVCPYRPVIGVGGSIARILPIRRGREFLHQQILQMGVISYNGTMEVRSSLPSVVLNDQPRITDKTSESSEV